MHRVHQFLLVACTCSLLLGCAPPITLEDTPLEDTHLPPDAFNVSEGSLYEVTTDGFIPEDYWGVPIRALKPLGVYRDRFNVAVITRTNAHVERGVYFCTLLSSYHPMDEPGRKFRWNKKAGHLDYVFTK